MGAVAGEDGTIGERLATADAARFVGRRAELERLESLLVEVPERNIVLLHGSGGIGKSTLLRELVRRADRAGWPSRIIEARDLPEQPRGLQAVLDDLRSSPRALVVFDSWEEAELLTPHLQDLVLRDLPAGWVVVISGRRVPAASWGQDGWEHVTSELRLGPLADADALACARWRTALTPTRRPIAHTSATSAPPRIASWPSSCAHRWMRRGADYTLSMETPPSPFPGDGEGAAASGEAPHGNGYPPKFAKEGLTFDDVLLLPAESNVLPNEVSTAAHLTPKIQLSIPIVSAAMDTVTEAPLAIAMARQGGIGIVHRNLSVAEQVTEVDRVKRSQSGMITDPVTLPPDAPVRAALDLMARYKISGIPIVDGGGKLVGHPHRTATCASSRTTTRSSSGS